MCIRLKANATFWGNSRANQMIQTAMKKYGTILADNGGHLCFQGAPDSRWKDADLVKFDAIQSSNFEVVQMTPPYPGYDSGTAPKGQPPNDQQFYFIGFNGGHRDARDAYL
jgi:hypothetical protein